MLAALARIVDPGKGTDIVSAGMVQGIADQGLGRRVSRSRSILRAAPQMEPVRVAAEAAVKALARRVSSATVVLTAHSETPGSAPAPTAASGSPMAKGPPPELGGGTPRAEAPATSRSVRCPPAPNQGRIDGVENIIAVASGKGGVGKSTVAANLALALLAEGKKVGLLDADVYGPSQPRMLGITGRPSTPDGETIMPLRGYGLTVMSMGFMVDEDQSVVWRGPMLMSALTQMLHQVAWGDARLSDRRSAAGHRRCAADAEPEGQGDRAPWWFRRRRTSR